METPPVKATIASFYNCQACGETIYKPDKRDGWFRSNCPHCGVRLSTNLRGFALCFGAASMLEGAFLL